MLEVLTGKGLSVALRKGNLAVSPKVKITEDLRTFIRQNKQEIVSEICNQSLESLFASDDDMRQQFNFEVEERAAIMIFDGSFSEEDAIDQAYSLTAQLWFELFCEK